MNLFRKENIINVRGKKIMNYSTTEEISKKWDISTRRITTLCNEGRIAGAEFKGGIWLIPCDAEKPQSLKRGRRPERGIADDK